MKESVLQRVKAIKANINVSVNSFASTIGMSQTTVNNYFNGQRSISIEFILAVLKAYPDVSAEWLLRGEGSMHKSEKTVSNYNIKGTDNSVNISGSSQGDITTNGDGDKDAIIKQLLDQQKQLIALLASK